MPRRKFRGIILSLCDYSGNWSQPYEEHGYHVIRIDLKHGTDAILWPSLPSDTPRLPDEFTDFPGYKIHGILAAPVCTVFANSGSRIRRSDSEIRKGLALVDACMRIAVVTKPKFFALENPVGKLQKWLGRPRWVFNPCDYGDPYTKRTCLWGWFNPPVKTPVQPVCGSKILKYGGKTCHTKTIRSLTPMGFANAFFRANP